MKKKIAYKQKMKEEIISYQYKDKVEGFSIRYRFILSIFVIAWTVIGGV